MRAQKGEIFTAYEAPSWMYSIVELPVPSYTGKDNSVKDFPDSKGEE